MNYKLDHLGELIKKERKNHHMTQAQLAKQIGSTAKQISVYEKRKATPSTDTLLKICEVFDCELGYLLQEPDYLAGTRELTTACKATGLDSTSINILASFTKEDSACLPFKYETDKYKRLLDHLLQAESVPNFLVALGDLDEALIEYDNALSSIKDELGDDLFSKSIELYLNSSFTEEDFSCYSPEEQAKALSKVGKAIDSQYDLSFKIKVCRYELQRAFDALINELFPTKLL